MCVSYLPFARGKISIQFPKEPENQWQAARRRGVFLVTHKFRSFSRAGNKFRRWKIIDCFPRVSFNLDKDLSSAHSGGHRFSAATLLPLVRDVCVHNRKITQRRATYLRENEIHHPSRRTLWLLTKHICDTRFLPSPNDKSLSLGLA